MFRRLLGPAKNDRIRELFSMFLSPAAIDQALAPAPAPLNSLASESIEFAFVAVRGATSRQTGQYLGKVASTAQEHNWMVLSFVCNVAVLVSSKLALPDIVASERRALVQSLISSLGEEIKIVDGCETGDYGAMGDSNRKTFGILLPFFFEIMGMLASLRFGEARTFGDPSNSTLGRSSSN